MIDYLFSFLCLWTIVMCCAFIDDIRDMLKFQHPNPNPSKSMTISLVGIALNLIIIALIPYMDKAEPMTIVILLGTNVVSFFIQIYRLYLRFRTWA